MAKDSARLFFALYPPPEIRTLISQSTHSLLETTGGKPTLVDNIHLTLSFLGDIALPEIDAARSCAANVFISPFTLELTKVGYWRHNKILWLAPSTVPTPLIRLVDKMTQNLKQAGFQVDNRPYSAHLTLIRKADVGINQLIEPIMWRVNEFALMRSISVHHGTKYEVISRWLLHERQDK